MPCLLNLSKELLVRALDFSSDTSVLELAAASRAVKTEVEECRPFGSEGLLATSSRCLEHLWTLEISWFGRPQEDSICVLMLRSGVPKCHRDAGLPESCQGPCIWHHWWPRELQPVFVLGRWCEWALLRRWRRSSLVRSRPQSSTQTERMSDPLLTGGHQNMCSSRCTKDIVLGCWSHPQEEESASDLQQPSRSRSQVTIPSREHRSLWWPHKRVSFDQINVCKDAVADVFRSRLVTS